MNAGSVSSALWTAAEAAAATGGRAAGTWNATGVAIDSRACATGDLFVALAGPNHDGHDYVASTLDQGASAAMVARDLPDVSPERLLVVSDTLAGLTALARRARARAGARIAAVTGSVGKTGTKELLRCALATAGDVVANVGNLNNHIGAPLSLARLPKDAAFGVFELGMNHAGEIEPLSRLVRPDAALITTVEAVHTEALGSVEAVADAKAEIFAGLEADGTAVLNRDNPHFERLAAHAAAQGASRIVGFGEDPRAEARLVSWTPARAGGQVTARIEGRDVSYEIALSGKHWALNSVAALATAAALGVAPAQAAPALHRVAPLAGRGARHRISVAGGAIELIDESYNASPAAVRAALATLAGIEPGPGGRRIVALGDMLELGDAAARMHADLARDLAAARVDLVFTAGPLTANLHAALPTARRGVHADDAAGLIEPLVATLRAGDVILVKGSLGSRMGPVVSHLLDSPGAETPTARDS